MKEYFENLKDSDKMSFVEKTPQGNCIKGIICKKQNRYYGSLLITEVNGEKVEQFVQSFPKIKYLQDSSDIDLRYDVCCFEKLDGSCLILYPLFDADGHKLEIVPKTRGRAVADKHFLDLYDKIEKSSIYHYYKHKKGILYFEMYGILNQHQIIHYDTGIDIVLIGCYDEGRFYDPLQLWSLANAHDFKQPQELFRIDLMRIFPMSRKYGLYWDNVLVEDWFYPSGDIECAVQKVASLLDWLNRSYMERYGRLATEGVVINCTDKDGNQRYIKVKPKTILDGIRQENGVLKSDILKECRKYWDEYGSRIKEIYDEDPNHHTEYLHRMLSEDYNDVMIQKSKKKIENVFMQFWKSKEVPVGIHKICDELKEEYGDQGIGYCMRMFAQKYPMMKKQARTVYSILEVKLK